MPRPPLKRRRSNTQSPGRSKRAQSNIGLGNAPRVKLQQQLAKTPIGKRPQDSDDSDRLVTRTRHGRHNKQPEEIFASGGVAKGDKPGVFPSKQERRERLRSDTEEIVRRSRSKSVEAAKQRLASSRSGSAVSEVEGQPPRSVPAQNESTQSPQPTVTRSQPTPLAETSILGTLKPRRRQASILHLIANEDSSLINPEDEEQFLPDNESTPLNVRKADERHANNRLSSGSLVSSSRKRKLGAEGPLNIEASPTQTATPQSESIRTQSTELGVRSPKSPNPQADDDDIMAPPQSSSPESSPQKPKPPPAHESQKPTVVPTTEQLQSLMPSKRRKGNRQRPERTEFDIPDDSDSNSPVPVEDESLFLPRKRTIKSRGASNKDPAPSKSKPKTQSKAKKSTIAATASAAAAAPPATPARNPPKATKSTSTPLTVVTPRTPLPLTRNPNQENKTITSAARNRNSKPNGAGRNNKTDSVLDKQHGGSLQNTRRGLRSVTVAVVTGAESDKENDSVGVRRSSRKANLAPQIEEVEEELDGVEDLEAEVEVEPELGRGGTSSVSEARIIQTPATDKVARSADVRAWKDKWADIDDWSLDYEEVDISTGSSSPSLMKVSVL